MCSATMAHREIRSPPDIPAVDITVAITAVMVDTTPMPETTRTCRWPSGCIKSFPERRQICGNAPRRDRHPPPLSTIRRNANSSATPARTNGNTNFTTRRCRLDRTRFGDLAVILAIRQSTIFVTTSTAKCRCKVCNTC